MCNLISLTYKYDDTKLKVELALLDMKGFLYVSLISNSPKFIISIFLKKSLISFRKIGNLNIKSYFVVLSLAKFDIIKNLLLFIFKSDELSIFLKFL